MIAYVLLRVFLLLLLVAANAFFAAAEFSLVSVRDTRIQQLIDARRIGARIVQKLHRNLDEVVNGVQLGVTIVSLTLGWVGEPLLAQMMLGPVRDVPHASVYAHGIAIFISFVLITCLHVILGELVPKSLELDNITVREVMVPRPAIFSLPGDLTISDALSRVVEEQHSRVPVYDPQRGPEHIVGVLYAKDLMRWTRLRLTAAPDQPVATRVSSMKISQIMHDVLVVPETKVLTELLGEFQHRKRHLAVVVDEFGSTAGVITVEDVLEQLVGELEDEFDVASTQPAVTDANAPLQFDGAVNIRDLEAQYELKLPQDEGFETLAGFVLSRLQRIPKEGDTFEYEGRRFLVEKMEGNRIATIKIEPVPAAAAKQLAGD